MTKSGSATVLTETYTYVTNSAGQPTGQVATHRTRGTGYDVTNSYTYDGNGNILSVSDGTYTTTYQYDSANQLIRENNQQAGQTYLWTYDNAGNILSKQSCAYTTGTPGSGNTQEYVYGDSPWGDLLTEYSGWDMTYDSIGNVLCGHLDDVFTWKNGRQLISYKQDGNEHEDIIHYEYNADGLRTKAYDGYTTYRYVYNGSSLVQLEIFSVDRGAVTDTLYFTYDTAGTPQTVKHNGTVYYYVTNLQGDVTAILDGTGTVVVSYTYDAWGNHTSGHSGTGALASTLGRYNPLRYRGYIYDVPSELYYLQSRYYNPELGRFINADGLIATGQGILGGNLFTYCGNNPVNFADPTGMIWELVVGLGIVAALLLSGCSSKPNDSVLVVSTKDWMRSSQTMENDLSNAIGANSSKTIAATNNSFTEEWNSTSANYVVIHTHGSPTSITDNKGFSFSTKDSSKLVTNSNIEYVIITACSVGGAPKSGQNFGQMLSTKISSSGYVICSTNTVSGNEKSFHPLHGGQWVVYQNGILVDSSIENKITMEYIAYYIYENLR